IASTFSGPSPRHRPSWGTQACASTQSPRRTHSQKNPKSRSRETASSSPKECIFPGPARDLGQVEQYVGEIKGGLRPAMKLTVIGMVHSNPKSFSVTLLCDPLDANKDVGLLFTVNFSDKSITRNARIAGKWGREEKTIPYFPFTAGDTFKMELLCEHQQIRVLLDGRQLCDFTHRIQPLNLVKALQISGDIKLTKVA
ncbi:galectin-related protein A, partial [Columba guinea]